MRSVRFGIAALLIAAFGGIYAASSQASLQFENSWGGAFGTPSFNPQSVGFGPGGDVFVSDQGGRVIHLTADGQYVDAWSSTDPTVAPNKTSPGDLAVDGDGNVWVVDELTDSIRKYSATGTLILQRNLNLPDYRFTPRVAFESGSIYVLSGNEVMRLSLSGDELNHWTFDTNTEDSNSHIAGDGAGHVFVTAVVLSDNTETATATKSVLKFDPDGTEVSDWSSPAAIDREPLEHGGTYISSVGHYYGVAPSGDGGAFVTGPYDGEPHHMVEKLSSSGAVTDSWGSGYAGQPALAPDGHLWMPLSEFKGTLGEFSQDGTELDRVTAESLPKYGDDEGDGKFGSIDGLSLAPNGKVVAFDGGNQRVENFNPDGRFLNKYDISDFDETGLSHVIGTDDGFAFVNDLQNKGVTFTDDGTETSRWELDTGTRHICDAIQIAPGRFAVLSSQPPTVDIFDAEGDRLSSWHPNGPIDSGARMALSPDGNLLILEWQSVSEYSPDGTLVRSWTFSLPSGFSFSETRGIGEDTSGHVLVLVTNDIGEGKGSVVLELTATGQEIESIPVSAPDAPNGFGTMAVGPSGSVYLSSETNIYRYQRTPTPFLVEKLTYGKNRRSAKFRVYAPAPGTVSIAGDKRVKATRVTASAEGIYTVRVTPKPKYMRPRRHKRALRLKLRLNYVQTGQPATHVNRTVVLKRKFKKPRHRHH